MDTFQIGKITLGKSYWNNIAWENDTGSTEACISTHFIGIEFHLGSLDNFFDVSDKTVKYLKYLRKKDTVEPIL